ncbi:HNH endonuclease [Terriglobus sp.]|uniref:HNH endonuclease n=1 Tax=Terriglobus sp. TaxID=1889013 RepID=UPI003AFFE1C1
MRKLKGATIEESRILLYKRQKGLCWYCRQPCRLPLEGSVADHGRDTFTLDYILPLSQGGTSKMGNLVGCCRRCNVAKGAKVLPPALLNLVR